MPDPKTLDIDDVERRMRGALQALKQEFGGLRTGRASASLLDPVTVEAYGQVTPINQVSTINAPEPRLITVQVWDKGMVGAVDKAIRSEEHTSELQSIMRISYSVYRLNKKKST